MILNLYKQRGETPLQCIERFKVTSSATRRGGGNIKMTYLGRLDPMADGVLLVGSGEEDTKQKRKEEFLNLDKDYDFVVLFGFATDTYDCLGKITHPNPLLLQEREPNQNFNISEMDLIKICKLYEGEREQKYPFYSSKQISSRRSGNPSPASRGGEGGEVKKITIYKMQFKGFETLSPKELFGRLLMDISKVKGDFRQAEILEMWKERLCRGRASVNKNVVNKDFNLPRTRLGRFSASVSSGTYIRSIVNDMGNTLGCGACALSITRTRVGGYSIKDSLRF